MTPGSCSSSMATCPGLDGFALCRALRDAEDEYLDGRTNYRLRVPANPPVAQFWSMTVYSNLTRGPVVTDTKKIDTSSRQNLVVNADGTTDACFVPDSPGADLETNWVKTNPGEGWFAYFRCYGSLQPYFDKTWVLLNLEKCRNPCQG